MTTKLILSAFWFYLFPFSLYSQHTMAVLFVGEGNDKGDISIIAENRDFCDYYIRLDFDELDGYDTRGHLINGVTIGKGRETVATLVRRDSGQQSRYHYYYYLYKGNIDKKINPQFVYALPAKCGESVRYIPAKSFRFTSLFNLEHAGDTVYACRGGVVCDDDLSDMGTRNSSRKKKITIYHDDGSFGEYSGISKALIYAGSQIKTGQPVAVVDSDERGQKEVGFSLYFLDKNQIKNKETGNKYSSLVPVFHSANKGSGKLEEGGTYIGQLTEELLMQDMSKKELKKKLKNKEREAEK